MCKGQKVCTALGNDSKLWSSKSTLPPQSWMFEEIEKFIASMELAFKGDVAEAVELLNQIKSDELRAWFVDHTQNAGKFRFDYFKEVEDLVPKEKLNSKEKSISPKHESEVLERDHYTCQYCGIKLIPNKVLKAFSSLVGEEKFSHLKTTNAEMHGVLFFVKPTIDHVIPWSMGGLGNPSNFVASCWGCNFGKVGWSLKQLGLDDPRNNKFKNGNWQGLKETELNQPKILKTSVGNIVQKEITKTYEHGLKTKNISFNADKIEQVLSDNSRVVICTRKFTKSKGGKTKSDHLGISVYFKAERWESNKALEAHLRKVFDGSINPDESFREFARKEEMNPNSKVVYEFKHH